VHEARLSLIPERSAKMTFSAMGVGMFAGIRIVEDGNLTVETQDWSGVRSPARARRRLKRGFRQRIVYGRKPDPRAYSLDGGKTYIMHPVTYEALKLAAVTEILPTEKSKPTDAAPANKLPSVWITPRFVPMLPNGYWFNSDAI
jgi:hypothetical protein